MSKSPFVYTQTELDNVNANAATFCFFAAIVCGLVAKFTVITALALLCSFLAVLFVFLFIAVMVQSFRQVWRNTGRMIDDANGDQDGAR